MVTEILFKELPMKPKAGMEFKLNDLILNPLHIVSTRFSNFNDLHYLKIDTVKETHYVLNSNKSND